MREIKFRAWDTTDNKMVQPKDIARIHIDEGLPCAILTWEDEPILFAELLQYTGLKDKNGKEIYEGDIVKHHDYPHCKAGGRSVVKWQSDACGFVPFVEDNERYGRPLAGEWIEVIGNIYEDGEKDA